MFWIGAIYSKILANLIEEHTKIFTSLKINFLPTIMLSRRKYTMNEQKIIGLFNTFVKGKKFNQALITPCGAEGQWLEKLMGIHSNNRCQPDIYGYEMKKQARKITFGDWSGVYLFSSPKQRKLLNKINEEPISLSREEFIKNFGHQTSHERFSWSGECVPKIGKWNRYGQKLVIDNKKNILALYSFKHDKRENKSSRWKNKKICIALWENKALRSKVNSKFNQRGFFICCANKEKIYYDVIFGPPMDFTFFIEAVREGKIYLDSGMYHDTKKTNNRLYSNWRANEKFWLQNVFPLQVY